MPPQKAPPPDFIPASNDPDFIPAGAAPSQTQPPQPGFLDPHEEETPLQHVQEFGRGLLSAPRSMFRAISHPIDTLESMGDQTVASGVTPYGTPIVGPTGNKDTDQGNKDMIASARTRAGEQGQQMAAHPGYTAGNVVGQAGITAGAAKVLPMLPEVTKIPGAIRDAAIGDPDVAALKGLRVAPSSKEGLRTLSNVDTARPFLQGAGNLQDLQDRIPRVKAEIWGPYGDAVERIGDKQVQGPNGPTTVRELENERLRLSAQRSSLQSRDPLAVHTAIQKGLGDADLDTQYNAVRDALDPHLREAGIDPGLIRQTHGSVQGIDSLVNGESTLAEKPQPYGFGKILNLDLHKPLSAPGEILSGFRDVVAGRPLLRGKPTDINIREAFRNAGPKPDLGPNFSQPSSVRRPLGLPADVPGNADFGNDYSAGSFTRRPDIIPPARPSLLGLPAQAGAGDAEPMVAVKGSKYPPLADGFARDRIVPTRFLKPMDTSHGVIPVSESGQGRLPELRALPAPGEDEPLPKIKGRPGDGHSTRRSLL